MLLTVEGLSVGYGAVSVIEGLSLAVPEGSVCAVLGPNGAGKTTLLRALSGTLTSTRGSVHLDGRDITRLRPARRVSAGIAHCPEGRRMFGGLSVEANLRLGGYTRSDRDQLEQDIDDYLDRWPVIGRRRRTAAGMLSGGEQQLVALGRALMSRPRLLLLDEPSLGLAPIAVSQMYEAIVDATSSGQHAVVLVEQSADRALQVAERAVVLVGGSILWNGSAGDTSAEEVGHMYFGRTAGGGGK